MGVYFTGGLLIALPKADAEGYIKEIYELEKQKAFIVGHVITGDKKGMLADATITEVSELVD